MPAYIYIFKVILLLLFYSVSYAQEVSDASSEIDTLIVSAPDNSLIEAIGNTSLEAAEDSLVEALKHPVEAIADSLIEAIADSVAEAVADSFAEEAEELKFDLILKAGHVLDPANNINQVLDVAIRDGRIAFMGTNIPEDEAEKVINVSGRYVTPGLIDIHAHVFYDFWTDFPRSVIPDDVCLPSGVTTVVDAGTVGADVLEDFIELLGQEKSRTKTRVLAFVNIASTGMNRYARDPAYYEIVKAAETAMKYPDFVVGFKSAHYHSEYPYYLGRTRWAAIDSLLMAGRATNLPVMVEFSPYESEDISPETFRELLLKRLRPGDMLTHVYAGNLPVADENGKLNPDIYAARKRGVLFDLGHGENNFRIKHALEAISLDFIPDIISSDIHGGNTTGPVINMLNVMSKMMSLGIPPIEVIKRATVNPALAIKRPELGTLGIGSTADIAVLNLLTGEFGYTDNTVRFIGSSKLECAMTIVGGEVVWDPDGLTLPLFTDEPKEEHYLESDHVHEDETLPEPVD